MHSRYRNSMAQDSSAHPHSVKDPHDHSPPMFLAWAAGLPIAGLLLWLIGYVFCDCIVVMSKDEQLDTWVRHPDYSLRFHSEGWGTSHFAEHGIVGTKQGPAADDRTVVIWGDSYVEAVHVDDSTKMHNQFNRLWQKKHPDSPLRAYAVGQAGYHMFDYLKLMPKFGDNLGDVQAHVIVLHTPSDLYPPKPGQLERPVSQQVQAYSQPKPLAMRWREPWRDLELSALWILVRDSKGVKLRWQPGAIADAPQPAADPAPWNPEPSYWGDLLTELKQRADAPVTILYLPTVPFLEDGQLIVEDENESLMTKFAEACHEHGIGFVSMRDTLIEAYHKHGRIPRGFANTLPGRGHLNDLGHAVVAHKLTELMEERVGAVLSR